MITDLNPDIKDTGRQNGDVHRYALATRRGEVDGARPGKGVEGRISERRTQVEGVTSTHETQWLVWKSEVEGVRWCPESVGCVGWTAEGKVRSRDPGESTVRSGTRDLVEPCLVRHSVCE